MKYEYWEAGYEALDAAIRHTNDLPDSCAYFTRAMSKLRDLPETESLTVCFFWIFMARAEYGGKAHASVRVIDSTNTPVPASGEALKHPEVLAGRFAVAVFNADHATAHILWRLAEKDPDTEETLRLAVVELASEILAPRFPNGINAKKVS